MAAEVSQLIDHLFRREAGKMIAFLTRRMGLEAIQTAEDIVQDTLLRAMNTWGYKGVPENPEAWLYRVAQHKAIDWLRRTKNGRAVLDQWQRQQNRLESADEIVGEGEIRDSQLRLIFACCHPCIPEDAQIALTLKTLCGLSVAEIARAYLLPTETMAKRIYRAKEKIRNAGIQLDLPGGYALKSRLDAVLKTLYLLFNEGYNSSHPDTLVRDDLCLEALRLCYLLKEEKTTNTAATNALIALMCFQVSRLEARLDSNGHIVLLRDQDRKLWHQPLISKGFYYLDQSKTAVTGNSYQLEAAIAAVHAAAPDFAHTDWKMIYQLYEQLYMLQPTPIVALNKAIASSYAINPAHGLKELQNIQELNEYYLYYASLGDVYAQLGNSEQARFCYQQAEQRTVSGIEKELLRAKARLETS